MRIYIMIMIRIVKKINYKKIYLQYIYENHYKKIKNKINRNE